MSENKLTPTYGLALRQPDLTQAPPPKRYKSQTDLAKAYLSCKEGQFDEYHVDPDVKKRVSAIYVDKIDEVVLRAGYNMPDEFGLNFYEFITTDFGWATPAHLCTFLHNLETGVYEFFGPPKMPDICRAWRAFIEESRATIFDLRRKYVEELKEAKRNTEARMHHERCAIDRNYAAYWTDDAIKERANGEAPEDPTMAYPQLPPIPNTR